MCSHQDQVLGWPHHPEDGASTSRSKAAALVVVVSLDGGEGKREPGTGDSHPNDLNPIWPHTATRHIEKYNL